MRIDEMKIATRLGVGFGLVSALLALITALGLNRMAEMDARIGDIIQVNDVESRLAASMYQSITERALALRNLILLSEPAEADLEFKRIADQDARYRDTEARLSAMFRLPSTSDEQKTLMAQIGAQAAASVPLVGRALRQVRALDRDGAYRVLRHEFKPVQQTWWQLLRALIKVEERQNAEAARNAEMAYRDARRLMLLFGGLALLVSAVAARLITRGLARQLGGEPSHAADVAGRIAAGGLRVEIDTAAHDRSSLMYAMRSMRDSLADIVGKVQQSTDTIASAAVEAARAGEQGRGFAVVATEVRNLAQRSATAAQEIKALIGDSVGNIDGGAQLVGAAGSTMRDIVDSVQRVSGIMAEIAAATDEQTSDIEQINQTILQMDTTTQQNSALVEEAAAADSLSQQAGQLMAAVSIFKLRHVAGPPAPDRDLNQQAGRGSAPPAGAPGRTRAAPGLPQPGRAVPAFREPRATADWDTF